MAAVSVHRHFENDQPESAQQGQQGLTQTVLYMVTYANPLAGDALAALTATDGTRTIPAYYAAHPTVAGVSVVNKSARRIGKTGSFYVQVDYGIPPLIAFEQQPGGSDVRWNIRVTRSSAKEQEGVNRDFHGHALVNSAGTVFPPDIPKPEYDTQYTITFNLDTLATFLPACDACQGKLNTNQFSLNVDGATKTFDPGTILISEAAWTWQKMPDGSYQRQGTIVALYRSLLADGIHYVDPLLHPNQVLDDGTELGWAVIVANRGQWYKDKDGNLIDAQRDVLLETTGELRSQDADALLIAFQVIPNHTVAQLFHGL